MIANLCLTAIDTWGPVLKDGVQKQELTVFPYELQLDYDYWNYRMDESTSGIYGLVLTLTQGISCSPFSLKNFTLKFPPASTLPAM